MFIAGLQKTSLIDYPENIATVVFTQGCNFRCPYCHNPKLVSSEREGDYLDEKTLFDFLERRKNLLDGVVITGGEPSLQPDLTDFIKKVKAKGFKVKLDTNGVRFPLLKSFIEDNLIDYLALDVKTTFAEYQELTGCSENDIISIKKSIEIIIGSGIAHEFRTTVVPGYHEEKHISEIASYLRGADKYVIQNFRPHNTLDPELKKFNPFTDKKLRAFKKAAEKYLDFVKIRN